MKLDLKTCLLASLTMISLTACSQNDDPLGPAPEVEGQLEATRTLPEYPQRCRIKIGAGIEDGDDVRVIARKLDAALYQQWGRTDSCAAWYDDLKDGFASEEQPEGPQ